MENETSNVYWKITIEKKDRSIDAILSLNGNRPIREIGLDC